MALTPGSRLGDFEIRERIGVGGMGEVWLARDGRLGREVAIKVLPEPLATDADRLARFEREARLLASLNHPNVATIHGVDQIGDVCFLVLELVKGDSLARRVAEGPLPVREALSIARQIAAGMEAAHESGVIHRDLKPANVCLTPDGTAKVLDFGLAKSLAGGPAGSDVTRTLSQSDSFEVTSAGVVLGTTAYMSPEQARGRPIDRRTDIWAFGCVLFELLTGRRPFVGEDATEVLASILKQEPDWELLPAEASERVRSLLHRCLEKDPMQRLRDIGDARIMLEEELGLRADPASGVGRRAAAPAARPVRRVGGAGLVGITAASMAVGAVLWSLVGAGAGPGRDAGPHAEQDGVTRLSVVLPADTEVGILCFSADGRTLVYDTDPKGPAQEWGQLWVRRLDDFAAHPLDGTRGADVPALSPDGRWVAFFVWDDQTQTRGKLRKISVDGGPAVTLLDRLGSFARPSWLSNDELLVYEYGTHSLSRLGAGGGPLTPVVTFDVREGEFGVFGVSVIPGGAAVLLSWFALVDGRPTAQLRLLRLADGSIETLVDDGRDGRYVSTGRLVFSREDALLAVPFDRDALRVTGNVVPLLSGLKTSSAGWDSDAFAISDAGHLAYMPGFIDLTGRRIMSADREGHVEELSRQDRPYAYGGLVYSPDGRWLALGLEDPQGLPQVWLMEVATGAQSPLSRDGAVALGPVWSPDGSRVAWFQFMGGNQASLWWRSADRSDEPEELLAIDGAILISQAWSPDGAWLAYQKQHGTADRTEVWLLAMNGRGETRRLLASPGADFSSLSFSPDGRWIAYVSNESGRDQVYVRGFEDGAAKGAEYVLSNDSVESVFWSPTGAEVFCRTKERCLAVAVRTEGGFAASAPEPVFIDADLGAIDSTPLGVSPDGQRFAFVRAGAGEEVKPQINVVLNWFDELRRQTSPSGR